MTRYWRSNLCFEKQAQSNEIKDWIGKLEDALYKADDLVDMFRYEALRRRVMLGNKRAKKVRVFFSSSNQLAFRLKMGYKLKDIREELDSIRAIKPLYLMNILGETRVSALADERETHSFEHEEEIIGRDDDKMSIIQLLLDSEFGVNVGIIPIVGIGGLGKTALAQLVFNDEKVQKHFELKLWVCISDAFELKPIVKKIIESATGSKTEDLDLEQLQSQLRREIGGKKYLLVLDDVWNDDNNKWDALKKLLTVGARGSRILVTTRSEKVAEITSTIEPYYKLSGMDDEKSWVLFRKMALIKKGREPAENSNIMAIGREILGTYCKGLPLAIRTIGRLLQSRSSENEWVSFRNDELRNIAEQGENDISKTLKLSYNHLPSHLKHCFAYCSLFPKDYGFNADELINLWMAQGFIVKSSNQTESFEDGGNRYFKELYWRSFVQELKIDELGHMETFKMHDLLHDLAISIARTSCAVIKEQDMENFNQKTRHVYLDSESFYSWDFSKLSVIVEKKMSTVRSFLSPLENVADRSIDLLYSKGILHSIFSNLKSLRALTLRDMLIMKIPNSFDELKHLRYLDLSHNRGIKMLPSSTNQIT